MRTVLEHTPEKEPEISVRSNAARSTRLSSEEIYMVLNHNHLEHLEEDKKIYLQKLILGVLVRGLGR